MLQPTGRSTLSDAPSAALHPLNSPVTTPDPYHARRRRKVRLITGIGLFLLSLVAVPWVVVTVAALIPEFPTLRTLAALLYPDPHPEQSILLTFSEHQGGINIKTEWLPIYATTDDDGNYTGFLAMQLRSRVEPIPRDLPERDVSIEFATVGEVRLPAHEAMRHTLTITSGESTVRVKPDADHIRLAAKSDDPPFRDFMLYYAPTTIIVEGINNADLTISLAGFECVVPQENFEALRAFTATLKPGYTPPAPSIP